MVLNSSPFLENGSFLDILLVSSFRTLAGGKSGPDPFVGFI